MAKRQEVRYTEEAVNYLLEHYNEKSMETIRKDLKKILGKSVTANAVRIKASRLGLECMQTGGGHILVKDIDAALHTQQGSKYARRGKFAKRIKGINGMVVNVEKFWEYIKENENIDLTQYERGTLLPEPKPDKTGKSWLDVRIEQQQQAKRNMPKWDKKDRERLTAMLTSDKYTRNDICKHFNITANQLNYRIATYGLAQRTYIPVSDKERKEILELYRQGTPIKELEQLYSRSRKTILSVIGG